MPFGVNDHYGWGMNEHKLGSLDELRSFFFDEDDELERPVRKKKKKSIEDVIARVAVIDCETDPFRKGRHDIKPFVWGYYNGSEYHQFLTTRELAEFLSDRDEVVYAHNGGRFDHHFILPYIDELQQLMVISGRIAKARLGQCELRDSFNILPVRLADWQKTEIDYRIFEADKRHDPQNWQKICSYLKDDCRFLYEMVTEFIRQYGMHLTLAGAALKTWEAMTDQEAPKSSMGHYNYFHRYYYGGRVQCFAEGVADLDFKVADINSAYPKAMLSRHPLGTSSASYFTKDLSWVMERIQKNGPGAVFVSLEAQSRGAFPWRGPDDALYFPDDKIVREYHVTGWELQAALDTGTASIKRVLACHVFDRESMSDFSDYIMHFYNMRLEAKAQIKVCEASGDETGLKAAKAKDLFAKLFLNSLYGKFASAPMNYQNYVNVPAEYVELIGDKELSAQMKKEGLSKSQLDLGRYKNGGLLGPWVLACRALDPFEMRFYNIATSASITGYVRAFLWRTLCACERPLYCDTDSIAAVNFRDDVVFSDQLGDWKHEGDFDFYALAGRKMYAFHQKDGTYKKYDEVVSLRAEIKKKEKKAVTPDDIEDVLVLKRKLWKLEWKCASKGVKLDPLEIVRVARGERVVYEPEVPTFSIHSPPAIVKRSVKSTHRKVPTVDPKNAKKKS